MFFEILISYDVTRNFVTTKKKREHKIDFLVK